MKKIAQHKNKYFFLRLLNKTKDYRGDVKLTCQLYKKFLIAMKNKRHEYLDKRYLTFSCDPKITDFIPTSTKRSLNYYIERGWNIDDAKQALKLHQSHGYSLKGLGKDVILKGLEKRKITNSLKSEKELQITSEKRKRSKTPEGLAEKYNISIEDAELMIKEWCDRATKTKRTRGYKAKKESTYKCKEFWMAKGYTEEEARQILSKNSDTRSLESIMRSKGVNEEEARKIQESINEKCRKTYFSRSDEERKEITIKRTTRLSFSSKKSVRFFNLLLEMNPKLKKFSPIYGHNNELHLWDKENKKIYFYDFAVRELNLIIEYNGVFFHPRTEDNQFTTVEESIKKDGLKKELANFCGYDIIYVWESENEHERLLDLTKEISKRIEHYEHQKQN